MNNSSTVLAMAIAVLTATWWKLSGDAVTRQKNYTEPLACIPDNIKSLLFDMLEAEGVTMSLETRTDKALMDQELINAGAPALSIYKILSEGAVVQRNHEMDKVRTQISYLGLFLSWFMKNKGLTYEQIQAKYEKQFGAESIQLHQAVIDSATRVNKDLLDKMLGTLSKKLGFGQPRSAL